MSPTTDLALGPENRSELLLLWCDALEQLRDQARHCGEDFLAHLVEVAFEHAIALAMRQHGGIPAAEVLGEERPEETD